MTHPNSLDLEAFACGETLASIERHLHDCTTCNAFVERLRGALSAGPSRSRAADLVAAAAARVGTKPAAAVNEVTAQSTSVGLAPRSLSRSEGDRRRPRSQWLAASYVVLPLAAAAALLVFLKSPSTSDGLVPPVAPLPATSPVAPPRSGIDDPETTFKGGVQIAVIRERAGRQARFTGKVDVKPGDRLRVEVALDREQAIVAAVMGDDASWLELMPEGTRRPGTHFSERSARVDSSPMRGTILVGSPEEVARARSTRRFEGLVTIRIDWEAP
jgi:hypothetical protein